MNLGSVSKHFAATALGLVMDDFKHGRNVTALPAGLDELTWSSKLKNVLPEWSSVDHDIYEHLTLRDALSHVSGYPRYAQQVVSQPESRADLRTLQTRPRIQP
jgi:CubicO group peptidase (beta-lactamase class C family)